MRLSEREIHGGSTKAGKQSSPIILCERDTDILITKGCSTLVQIAVSPSSARVMARNLQRLARRIEARLTSAIDIEARLTSAIDQETTSGK